MTAKKDDADIRREFVEIVSAMTREERWRFFVKFVERHGTELRKARRAKELVYRLFADGRCPHCSGRLWE